MITQEQLRAMDGCAAYTEQGRRVGGVECVLVDDTTGRPEWARIADGARGPGGVFVPLRHAAFEDGRLVLPYPVSLIEGAPRAAPDRGSVLSVVEEKQLFAHYGLRDVREEVNAESGAGWGHMDRAAAIREGTGGREPRVSRLEPGRLGR
ncbi:MULTISPECIES: PRC-barrel domain-containing protein [Streptomyces]|uniref:PRC-barrel domain-containing protein n=1 Tax=Streptomyces TaxID=1883 RepID=UPI000F707BD6|nr:PRC-barrel domain-containing protein [Streptomyces sp. W1SF4]AZM92742.1 PRC-barrel domain containing protein [Streptomyces sp. W1SF4]